MKNLLFLVTLNLAACSSEFNSYDPSKDCDLAPVENGVSIVCADGTVQTVTNGQDGTNGLDGADGQDGIDGDPGLTKYSMQVPANECKQVAPDVWVENIRNGEFFDVYSNAHCEDRQGEHCDNVLPSFGSSGTFGTNGNGDGTLCSFNDSLVLQH